MKNVLEKGFHDTIYQSVALPVQVQAQSLQAKHRLQSQSLGVASTWNVIFFMTHTLTWWKTASYPGKRGTPLKVHFAEWKQGELKAAQKPKRLRQLWDITQNRGPSNSACGHLQP